MFLLIEDITELNVSFHTENVPIMPDVLRNLTHDSDLSTRNFRILKDYIRALEYLVTNGHRIITVKYEDNW
jgi:hypothetical protein